MIDEEKKKLAEDCVKTRDKFNELNEKLKEEGRNSAEIMQSLTMISLSEMVSEHGFLLLSLISALKKKKIITYKDLDKERDKLIKIEKDVKTFANKLDEGI